MTRTRLEKMAEEYAVEHGWCRGVTQLGNGYADGIKKGVELCREMQESSPEGLIIYPEALDRLLKELEETDE